MHKSPYTSVDEALTGIHLAIAFDLNYLQHFCALLSSILENTKKRKLHFHLISPDLDKIERERIQNYISSQNSESVFYILDKETIRDLILTGEWTHTVYYRLFFPMVVPAYVGRLLYLDADTLVINDLSALFNMDLGNYPVGSVYDNYVKEQKLIGVPEGNYFNSGVLLMDIKKWKEQDISNKTLLYLRTHPERILYVDQCGLNAVLKDNWKKLDCKFNVLYSYIPTESSLKTLKQFISDKTIVHFNMQRPWSFLSKNRLRFLYWHYLKLSPLAKHSAKRYTDFSVSKIPAWIKIRIIEIYLDNLLFQQIWRRLNLK